MAELPAPPEGIALAHFIVSADIERSRRFYTEVLGGRVAFSGPGGLTYVALVQQLDHHQHRRRPHRRQAGGHPADATRPGPGQQLPQHPGQRHPRRVRRMERPRRPLPDTAETAPVRDPLLHPRPRRPPDRSRPNHRPRRRLDTRPLAPEHARRDVRVKAETTGQCLQSTPTTMTEMSGGLPDSRDLSVTRPEHHRRNSRPITRPAAQETRLARPPAAAGLPAPRRFTRYHPERLSRRALAQCTATGATAGRPRSPSTGQGGNWSTGSAASTPPVGSPTGPKPPTHSRPPTRHSRRSPA